MEYLTPGRHAPAHQWHFLIMEFSTPGQSAPAFGQLAPMEFSTLGQDYLPFMEFSTPGRYAPTWGQLQSDSLIGAMKVGLKVGQVRLAHRASHAQIACVFYYHFSSFC